MKQEIKFVEGAYDIYKILMEYQAALQLIAAQQRSDGTWNRDREACRQLAENTLNKYQF